MEKGQNSQKPAFKGREEKDYVAKDSEIFASSPAPASAPAPAPAHI